MTGASTERQLFAHGQILVTTARIVVGPTTYALANVTSVGLFIQPRDPTVLIVGAVGAGCSVVAGIVGVSWGAASIATCLFIGLAAIFRLLKPRYWVRIATSGAETNAFYTADRRVADGAVAAINDAIIDRGAR